MSNTPLFPIGKIVFTPGAIDALKEVKKEPFEYLIKHVQGDWSELDKQDQKANRLAVERKDDRVFSRYTLPSGQRIWIITEWDRSYTTILLPEEY